MSTKVIQETLDVKGLDVTVRSTGDENDYLSLTDLAKAKSDNPRIVIANWMRLKDTLDLLGIWERLNNPDFNRIEFDTVIKQAGHNAFTMTPTKWITTTNAIGVTTKTDEMAEPSPMWISPWISPLGSVQSSASTYFRSTGV